MSTPGSVEAVAARAYELAKPGSASDGAGVADELLRVAGGDRRVVETARDRVAARVRVKVDDFEATAALRLLNKVLSQLPIRDPLDWRVRWSQPFRRP